MKKVFISQAMSGRKDSVIREERLEVIDLLKQKYDDVEILDSLIDDYPPSYIKKESLWYLAKSLEVLAEADAAYFIDGWSGCLGCEIEHLACEEYGIELIHD